MRELNCLRDIAFLTEAISLLYIAHHGIAVLFRLIAVEQLIYCLEVNEKILIDIYLD